MNLYLYTENHDYSNTSRSKWVHIHCFKHERELSRLYNLPILESSMSIDDLKIANISLSKQSHTLLRKLNFLKFTM